MFFVVATSTVVMSLAAATSWRQPQDGQAQPQQKQSKAKKANSSFGGCVDEQEGKYLLLNPESRAPIANLEAVGFPAEGFAKYLGQKVLVRGTSDGDGTRPTIKVRSIERVSDVCAPQQ
jgi:hypothetical protein